MSERTDTREDEAEGRERDSATAEAADTERGRGDEQTDDPDDAADSFLGVEQALAAAGAEHDTGRAVDVETVPATAVPAGYPVAIDTDDAVALTVERGDTQETVYLSLSREGALARLLALHDLSPERFGDLHGRRIPLETVDGHTVAAVPERTPGDTRGTGLALGGVLAATLATLGLAAAAVTGGLLVWLLLSVVVLPVALYRDAWAVRTRTDWDGGPLFWAALSALPGVGLLAVAVYLLQRRSSRRF